MITTTHDLDIVRIIGDRVLIFSEDHRIVTEGTPSTSMPIKWLT